MSCKFDYIILDIESYLIKACFACVALKEISEGTYCEVYEVARGKAYLNDIIDGFKERIDGREIVIVVGDIENNFRKKINPTYKHNRKGKPKIYDVLLSWLVDKYNVVFLKGVEADDTARIVFEDNDNFPGEKVIVSVDKDFYSVPCNFYRDNPNGGEVVTVTEEDARQNLFVQILTGDKADGYSGCKGVGPITACSLVNNTTTVDDIRQIFIDNGMKVEDFETNLMMAHILGIDNYNLKTNRIKHKNKKGEYIL